MFRKLILFIFFYINIANFIFSQTPGDLFKPPEIKDIIANKQIVIAMTDTDQPPFYFINKKGELDGLDVYIAKEIGKALNAKVIFNREAKSFNDVVVLVAEGKADLAISKLSRTLVRAQFVKYSNPYIVFHQALLINRLQLAKYTDEDNIRTFIRNFKGKIGVIAKSSYVNYAKTDFPQADIVEYPTWDDVVNAVEKGDILAAFRDELEVKKIIDSNSDAAIKLKPVIFTDLKDPIAIAVKYDRIQLQNWVNIFLESQNFELNAEKIINDYKNK